jgi:Glycosyl transferase family 11
MIIITQKFGQLANRLLLFAHFIGFAIENNVTLLNPTFDEYAQFFESTGDDVLCRYPKTKLPLPSPPPIRESFYECIRALTSLAIKAKLANSILSIAHLQEDQQCDLSNPDFRDLATQTKVVLAKGWEFRDQSNFVKHADKIRAYFTPIAIHRTNVSRLIDPIRAACDVLIGVHIRQGDYAEFLGGKYFYTVAQYLQMMERTERLFPNQKVTFLICSNVQHDRDQFSSFNCAFGTQHLIEDLYSLAQCDYLVGTLSTYILWASYYGQVPLYIIEKAEGSVLGSAIALDQFSKFACDIPTCSDQEILIKE